MLKTTVTSMALIMLSTVQMQTAMANSFSRLPVYRQDSSVGKDRGRLAQAGDRSGYHQNYDWDTQFGMQNRQGQYMEEERRFYQLYPERQTTGNHNNSCQGKDCNLRTFRINFDTKITPKIIRK